MAKNLEPIITKSNNLLKGDHWAIIIGISNYQDSNLNLQFAHRDAEELYKLLLESNGGPFKEDHIIKLINEDATQSNIIGALRDFLQKPATDDLVLIYFSCHGAYDPNRPKNSYILPYDTNVTSIARSAVPMREIQDSIRDNLLSQKVVIIADACHSAAIGGDMGRRNITSTTIINKYFEELAKSEEGTALITSAEANEVAFEDKKWGDGHGVFTHFLLEGLRGKADGYGGGKKDGIISIGELFEYVRDKVKENTEHKQHPLIGSSRYDRNLPLYFKDYILDDPTSKYSNILKRFSESTDDLFDIYDVSADNKKIVEEGIKQLVKDVDSIQSVQNIKNNEKEKIHNKIKNLIQKILEILPLEIQIFSILTPLNELLDKSNNITINQIVESEIQRLRSQNIDPARILLISESDIISEEKYNCIHSEHDSPHIHGAFSYYLIEGLGGKAADPDTGIISIQSLRKYIEDQMTLEGKQKPIYSIAEASNFDNIKIAISQGTFDTKIKKLIKVAEDLLDTPPGTNFIDIFSLQDAAKAVNELISLKKDHPAIPILQDKIYKALNINEQPTVEWLFNNVTIARPKIEEFLPGLYYSLPKLLYNVSVNNLATLPTPYILALSFITSQVRQNIIFERPDDPRLEVLTNKLRAVFDSEKLTKDFKIQENLLKQYQDQELGHSEKPFEKRTAIIIGINGYRSDKIQPLKGAENDAKEIRDKLIQYSNFDIPNEHYLVGSYATRRKILKTVSKIFRKNDPYELVSFYFSGYSIVDEENNERYLVPYNMDPETKETSGISIKSLINIIYNSNNVAAVLIILDCCHTGIATDITK